MQISNTLSATISKGKIDRLNMIGLCDGYKNNYKENNIRCLTSKIDTTTIKNYKQS